MIMNVDGGFIVITQGALTHPIHIHIHIKIAIRTHSFTIGTEGNR